MVIVYQNKIQFICYEDGGSSDPKKQGYAIRSRPKLPLANDFSFEKVAGEAQTLRQFGVGKSSLLIDGRRIEYSSSDDADPQSFSGGTSHNAVKIVRTAKDKVLPQ